MNSMTRLERLQNRKTGELPLPIRKDEPPACGRVTMLEANPRSCRWPYNQPGDDFRFCGQRTIAGTSWCKHHLKRAMPLHSEAIVKLSIID